MNELKKEDSELWFVEKAPHTISIGQTTHQDSVQKSGLRRILLDQSCLQRILFHKQIWPVAHFVSLAGL